MADYFDSGYSVRETPWHGKGFVPDRYPADWDEARKWAGLEWDPLIVPVYGYSGITADGSVTHTAQEQGDEEGAVITDTVVGTYTELPQKRVIRSDTSAHLGVVSGIYTLIDHGEMGDIVHAVLDQPNVRYETAGAIMDGRAVWALALLDEPYNLPGDKSATLPYLAVLNRHDGQGSCSAVSTAVRVVCANTFRAAEAESERNGTVFRFRHTGDWRDRIEEAKQTVAGVRSGFRAYCEKMEHLLGVPVTEAQTRLFVAEFIPMPPAGIVSDRVVGNVEAARKAVDGILASMTVEGAGVGGTAYGLVMAATEYLDHVRRARTWETRLNRTLLSHDAAKDKAVSLAMAASKA